MKVYFQDFLYGKANVDVKFGAAVVSIKNNKPIYADTTGWSMDAGETFTDHIRIPKNENDELIKYDKI